METHEQDVYGFYDGDYTFHVVEHDQEPDATFRVRIDSDPEQRARENEENHNKARPGWKRVRAATPDEIARWLWRFRDMFPTRPERHTEALRLLRLSESRGGVRRHDAGDAVMVALIELTLPMVRYRDFKKKVVSFAEELDDGTLRLTEEGQWLTSLMK